MNKYQIKELLPILLMLIFGLFVLIIIPTEIDQVKNKGNLGPDFFPRLMALTIIVLSIISLATKIIGFYKDKNRYIKEETEKDFKMLYLKILGVFIIIIGWIIFNKLIGFIAVTILSIISVMIVMGNRNYLQLLFVPIVFTILMYFVFINLLNISL